MLLFITTRGHSYTVKTFLDQTYGSEVPPCAVTTYDALFHGANTRRATHIFADIERMYPWELNIAAGIYRGLRAAGLPCLNDPARVQCRYELLRNLHSAGINPFTVYRADDRPQPARFPVFIREEAGHGRPLSALLPDQRTLDRCLADMRQIGLPLRGLLVVEYAAEPVAPGIWSKFGTFRVGDALHLDHAVSEDRWLVKYGKLGLATEEMMREEQEQVASNALAEQVRRAFEIAGIEWGRADHATYRGRQIVYEINTNPDIHALTKQRLAIRDETMRIARGRMAALLWKIDFGDGSPVEVPVDERLGFYRRQNAGVATSRIRP